MKQFSIGSKQIGINGEAFIIAEVGQAHDGSLGTAYAYIDAIAETGADAVKFQTHIADSESTIDEPFRIKFSKQDETRYAYWKRMEFKPHEWRGLVEYASQKGLLFLSSPFSVAAVQLLEELGIEAWKIGSGEIVSFDILDAIIETKKPVLLSTGMSGYDEIAESVTYLRKFDVPVVLFQCTSKYPVSYDEVGLNVIDELRKKFDCPVGLSDHSGSVFPALAAMAMGADIVELHVVFDKRMFGPDVPASLTFSELKLVVDGAKAFQKMKENRIDKDSQAKEMAYMRNIFGKSFSVSRDLCAGTLLTRNMLVLKKPGTGIPASEIDRLVGKRLKRDVSVERLLRWEDIEN